MQGEVEKCAFFTWFVLFVLTCVLVEEDTRHNLFAEVEVRDRIFMGR